MDYTFLTGIAGSILLVAGSALPEPRKKKHPVKSIKNWFFALGGTIMLIYAILGYLHGGAIFFVILQILVVISSVLMMLDTDDRIDAVVLGLSGGGLIIWSLSMFQGYGTVVFIIGLIGIGLGNSFEMGSLRRNIAFTAGSGLIAIFSFLEANWIFFWVNLFFSLFSAYYLIKGVAGKKTLHKSKR